MKKDKVEIELEYRIVKIQTTKFSFLEIDEENANKLFESEDLLSVNLGVSINIDNEKSTLSIDINTVLFDKNSNKTIVEHTGKTTFELRGLTEIYNKESDSFDIPDGLIVQLYAISYSHARALLATELNPTIFKEKFFLPVIDPTNIIKK